MLYHNLSKDAARGAAAATCIHGAVLTPTKIETTQQDSYRCDHRIWADKSLFNDQHLQV